MKKSAEKPRKRKKSAPAGAAQKTPEPPPVTRTEAGLSLAERVRRRVAASRQAALDKAVSQSPE